MRIRAALALLLAIVIPAAASADCKARFGQRVVVYGTMDDPDVLIWDSRTRMRSYGTATFDESQMLLSHALVVAPFTRVLVTGCFARDVSTKYSPSLDDAVSVTILSGEYRGRSGWVIGSAIKGEYRSLGRRGRRQNDR